MDAMLTPAFAAAVFLTILGLLAAIAAVHFYLGQRRRAQKQRPSTPQHPPGQWPLHARPLASPAEQRIWHWLQQVFPECEVMIKLPVTRFTAPNDRSGAHDWFPVLSSTYFTYTVCNPEGAVIGCVDLPGPHGLPPASRQLRQTLLAQCGIGYRELAPGALPTVAELRAGFLGSARQGKGDRAFSASEQGRLEDAALHLHQALHHSRSHRAHPEFAHLLDSSKGDTAPSPPFWAQQDSFLAALDSRCMALKKAA